MKPESPVLRSVERLRITELLEAASSTLGRTITRKELSESVFPDTDLGRPLDGKRKPLSPERKSALIGYWDRGRFLTACKPRHIVRIARFFGTEDVNKLIEFTPETPNDASQQPDPAPGSNA